MSLSTLETVVASILGKNNIFTILSDKLILSVIYNLVICCSFCVPMAALAPERNNNSRRRPRRERVSYGDPVDPEIYGIDSKY